VICKPPAVLNNGVARFFGLISCSLYLCHEYAAHGLWPFLFRQAHRLPSFVGMLLQIALAVATATCLHFAIERPFLRLKDRFHPRLSRVPSASHNGVVRRERRWSTAGASPVRELDRSTR
jgi:peptidoglycan/LPS O-acetylase OafA/YrhL